MQVSNFFKKKKKLQWGMLFLGLGFLTYPLILVGVFINPLLVLLFFMLTTFGFIKVFRARHYLGKNNSRFATGALILFILSWLQLLFLFGDLVMNQFIMGFFFLFQTIAFFMILFVPVKNKVTVNLGIVFLLVGAFFTFINPVCMVLSLGIFFPVGYVILGIVTLMAAYRIRRGDMDPVMVVDEKDEDDIDLDKGKEEARVVTYDGTTRDIKHNYRMRRYAGRTMMAGFAVVAILLIISGAYCHSNGKQMLIDFVLDEVSDQGEETAREDPEPEPEPEPVEEPTGEIQGPSKGKPVIVGSIGILGLFERFIFRDTPRENEVVQEGDDFDFLSITEKDFELSYHNIKLYDNGSIYDYNTNSYITFGEGGAGGNNSRGDTATRQDDSGETDIAQKLTEEWFPFGGVEKKDYRIWDPLANDTVDATYQKEVNIRGQECYVYNVQMENQSVVEIDDGDGNPFRVYAHQNTDYYLDSKTTVPVNLDVELMLGVDFPDLTRLQPDFENRVENRSLTVLIKDSDSVTGWKVEEVREEHHQDAYLDQDDTNIIWYEHWVERYDNTTGDPLDPSQQDNTVTKYAVDRTTYQYLPGLGNSQRSGYYTFPIGKIEKKNYPMWDEGAGMQSNARFIKETLGPLDRPVYLYEMRSENFTFEESDLLFPIDNPGALELVGDSTTRYWLDRETGFPLDIAIELVISVRSGGPLHGVKEPVYKVYFELPQDAKENLSKIVAVLAILLKCVNDKSLNVLYIDLQFASNLQYDLADIAKLIGYVFDTLDLYIPIITIGLGILIISIILARLYIKFVRYKRRKRKLERNLERLED